MRPHLARLRTAALAMDGSTARDHEIREAATRYGLVLLARGVLAALSPVERAAALSPDPGEDVIAVLLVPPAAAEVSP